MPTQKQFDDIIAVNQSVGTWTEDSHHQLLSRVSDNNAAVMSKKSRTLPTSVDRRSVIVLLKL